MVMSQPSITKALAMAIGGKDPLEKVILQTSPLAQGIEAPIRFQEKVAALDPMSSPSASELPFDSPRSEGSPSSTGSFVRLDLTPL